MLDKAALREILTYLRTGDTMFSAGPLGVEQAANRIMALQCPPLSLAEAALLVSCDYCGRTAGNWCERTPRSHPSRLTKALAVSAHVEQDLAMLLDAFQFGDWGYNEDMTPADLLTAVQRLRRWSPSRVGMGS